MDERLRAWLTDESNPAVRLRTQRELLGEAGEEEPVRAWLEGFLPADWREAKGLWHTYYLTAFGECGLKTAAAWPPEGEFDCGCGDFMLLRALTMLGLGEEPPVREALARASEWQLPDGGFLCRHRLKKLAYTPKSCVKCNLHALLLCAERRRRGLETPFAGRLVEYFWNHRLFYRTDAPDTLMLDGRPGWRPIDVFFPAEPMRVGLPQIVEALCALGYGGDARLDEAREMLLSKRDELGRVLLEGTLSKSYLPKERVGRPSRWATFYTLLAEKEGL